MQIICYGHHLQDFKPFEALKLDSGAMCFRKHSPPPSSKQQLREFLMSNLGINLKT